MMENRKITGKRKLPEIKDQKEREVKLKISEERKIFALNSKESFLHQIYGGEIPKYFKDISEENDPACELPLTLQVQKIINFIKLEYHKESIIQKVEKEGKGNLTHEQKSSIYLPIETLETSSDPVQGFFGKYIKEIPSDDWDKMLKLYFSSFTKESLIHYRKDSFIEVRKKQRQMLFKQGKEYLEDLIYKLQKLKLDEMLIKNNLHELYLKIGVCVNGFMTDLQVCLDSITELSDDLSENLEELLQKKRLKICQQAATAFVHTIIQRRIRNPLPAESYLKELAIPSQGQNTHAQSELRDAIASVEKFNITKSLDPDAKDFFTLEEISEFVTNFLDPRNLQKMMVEELVLHFSRIMYDVNSKEKMDNFLKQLDSLGPMSEDAGIYFEEDKEIVCVKKSDELLNKLRQSILKRVLKSQCLGEMFFKISIEKINPAKVPADIIFSNRMFHPNMPIFVKESKKNYIYLLQDRSFDCIVWQDDKEPSHSDIKKFFPESDDKDIRYAYGILKKKDRNELYYIQNNPTLIRKVSIEKGKKQLFQLLLKKLPKDVGSLPTKVVLSQEDMERLKSFDATERQEKLIYFIRKKPFAVQCVLSASPENKEKFDKIMQDLKESQYKNCLSIIYKNIQHSSYDFLYINHYQPLESFVLLPKISKEKSDTLLSLEDYFKNADVEDQVNVFHLLLKIVTIDLNFFVKFSPYVSLKNILKGFSKEKVLKFLIELLEFEYFSTASDFFKAYLFSMLDLPIKYSQLSFYQSIFLRRISENNTGKMKELLSFVGNHTLITIESLLVGGDKLTPIDYAAASGRIEPLKVLIEELKQHQLLRFISVGEYKIHFQKKLETGFRHLILMGKFKSARCFFDTFIESKMPLDFQPIIKSQLEEYFTHRQPQKFDELLKYFNTDDRYLEIILWTAAIEGNIVFLQICLKHGADPNIKDKDGNNLEYFILKGLFLNLNSKNYKNVLSLIDFIGLDKFQLKFYEFCKKEKNIDLYDLLHQRLSGCAIDESNRGMDQLKDVISIINKCSEPLKALQGKKLEFPALILAAKYGNLKNINILSELKLNYNLPLFNIALVYAVTNAIQKKDFNKMDNIIKAYPQITRLQYSEDGSTLGHRFIVVNCMPGLKSILKYNPAAVHFPDNKQKTCLTYAVEKQNNEAVELLIENKADLTYQDLTSQSYLHLAVANNNFYMAKILIHAGAPFDLKNIFDFSPHELASPNLNAFLTVQLIKRYIQILPHKMPIHLTNLMQICRHELQNVDDEKTDWKKVLIELMITIIQDSRNPLNGLSLFPHSSDENYTRVFTDLTNPDIYLKIAALIHQIKNESERKLEPGKKSAP